MKRFLALLLTMAAVSAAQADNSTDFTFQGRVTDEEGRCPSPRARVLTFRLYEAPTNGVPCLWARSLAVLLSTNGLFSAVLGDEVGSPPTAGERGRFETLLEAFAAAQEKGLYLGVTDQGASGEMMPRLRLAPVPQALRANGVVRPVGDFSVGGTLVAKDATFGATTVSGEVSTRALTVTDTLRVSRELNVGELQAADSVTVVGAMGVDGDLDAQAGLVADQVCVDGKFSAGKLVVADAQEATNATITVRNIDPGFPVGAVIMWSGSLETVPVGWHVCDGRAGTYDLQDRFIVGAGHNYDIGATGGEASVVLTEQELPRHTHRLNYRTYGYTPTHKNLDEMIANKWGMQSTTRDTHSTGGGKGHENRPPYYALYFIQRIK